MKVTNENKRVGHWRSCIELRQLRDGTTWLDGTVRTDLGIVEVLSSKHENYSRVDFVHRGRHHIRTWQGRVFTERGLVTVAMRFAREVVGRRAR